MLRIDDAGSRIFIGLGLVTAVVIGIAAFMVADAIARGLAMDLADRFLEMAAGLIAEVPRTREDLGPILAGEVDSERVAGGIATLSQYGYRGEVLARLDPALGSARLLPVVAALAGVVAGVAATALGVFTLSSTYARIDEFSAEAARVAEGDYALSAGDQREGSLGRLSYQIRQTAHRLSEQVATAQAGREQYKTFLSDISHQLKTPLASVRMYQELLLDMEESDAQPNEATAEARLRFLHRGLSQIDRMEWLVKSLLTQARMEAGSLPLNMERQSLRETVESVVESFGLTAKAAGITLSFDMSHTDVHLPHDRKWLGEAVSNVVQNALDHTPAGGVVDVRLLHTDAFSRIVIEDSGPGIPLEALPRIFTRFYNRPAKPDFESSATAGGSGAGLGLSLAKAIVERHGGVISAASGRGGTPGAAPQAAAEQAVPSGDEPRPIGPGVVFGARFTITLPYLTRL